MSHLCENVLSAGRSDCCLNSGMFIYFSCIISPSSSPAGNSIFRKNVLAKFLVTIFKILFVILQIIILKFTKIPTFLKIQQRNFVFIVYTITRTTLYINIFFLLYYVDGSITIIRMAVGHIDPKYPFIYWCKEVCTIHTTSPLSLLQIRI